MTKSAITVLFTLCCIYTGLVQSAEVDNYNVKGLKEIDISNGMNKFFNEALQKSVDGFEYKTKRSLKKNQIRFVRLFKKELYLKGSYKKLKAWIKEDSDLYYFYPETHIYKNVGGIAQLGMNIVKPSMTYLLNDIPVGHDKVTHFIGAGYNMWINTNVYPFKEQSLIDFWAYTEVSVLGKLFGGVYSNADLVADYEGLLFFKSFFDTLENNGNKLEKILNFSEEGVSINRNIDLRLHVNSFWNEAMLPSHYRNSIQEHLVEILPAFCVDYLKRPHLFLPKNEEALLEKYQHIGLRLNNGLRMDNVCK